MPAEAGRLANDAGAKRLLLTHVPLPDGGKWAMEEAAAEYSGPLAIAEPLKTYEV
jgi:ribonuclease BN (tRNA processing enzyme)